MVKPWVDYVEAGEARLDPYDEPSTCDPPYGGHGLSKDRFEARSTLHTMVNYSNHNWEAMNIDHIMVQLMIRTSTGLGGVI